MNQTSFKKNKNYHGQSQYASCIQPAKNKIVPMRQLLIILAILILPEIIFGQQLPTIIPPSAQAQTFMRYGEIPVDYSTGVPGISISLYSIKGRKLELPISISYHATGIKVNDVPSEVGLGWVLNAGGMVSRTIFGIPDERRVGKRTFSYASQLLDSVKSGAQIFVPDGGGGCLQGIIDFENFFKYFDNQDPMSDRFYYTLPTGISGVFRYDYLDETINDNNIITLPYRKLKIEKVLNTPHPSYEDTKIIGFKITDENGTVYIFEHFHNEGQYNSEWYLSKMISADATDTIKLTYKIKTPQSTPPIESQVLISPPGIAHSSLACTPVGSPFSYISTSNSQLTSVFDPVLESIMSSNAIVKFNYETSRQDFEHLYRLTDMTVSPINSPTIITKNVNFTPRYFGSNSTDFRLGLDNVIINAPGVTYPLKYTFTYENQVLPPYPYKLNNTSNPVYYPIDYWGYYNGKNNGTLVPYDFISDPSDKNNYGANRDPDPDYSKACMLKEIRYPTGGKTVFQFERNYAYGVYPYKADPSHRNGYYGGFRVANIKNYNEKDEVVGVKTYEYNGIQARELKREFFEYDQIATEDCSDGWTEDSRNYVFSDPILPLEVGAGLPIMYATVVEYKGTKTNNAGKTVYQYNPPYSPSDYFANPEHSFTFEQPREYHPFHYDNGNYIPELISKTEYSFDGINYHPVSKSENTYSHLYTREFQTGIKLTRRKTYHNPSLYCFTLVLIGQLGPVIQDYIDYISAIDTKAYQEASLLTNSKNYAFDPLDQTKFVVTNTDYTYNENNLEIYEKSISSSKGDLLKTTYKYPFDYCNLSNIYCNMITKNIITPVVEQIDEVNTTSLQSVRTNYSYWKSDETSYSEASGNLEIEKDVRNTASSTFTITKSAQFTIYLNLQMCVGHFMLNIIGPTPIQKFYYGCGEGNGSGGCNRYCSQNLQDVVNLTPGTYTITFSFITEPAYPNEGFYGTAGFSGSTSDSKLNAYITTAPTNKIYPSSVDVKIGENPYEPRLNYDSYDKNGNIMGVSKTNDIKEIYLWSYNGNYPVAKIMNSDYPTVESLLGGWVAVKDFSSKASPTDAEIKSFLSPLIYSATAKAKKLLVTIYTYSPLIGITSQIDPNGLATYYKYDTFGRLQTVKDNKGNILKSYDYHYKQ